KMSPLSDTTNMASSILQVDLFDHIKNMGWTTLPASIISFILFAILSPDISATDITNMEVFKQGLLDTGLVHWYAAVFAIAVLIVFSLMEASSLLGLASGSLDAIIV